MKTLPPMTLRLLLVSLNATALLAIAACPIQASDKSLIAVILGVCLGQLSLATVWLSCGGGAFTRRFWLSFFWLLISGGAFVLLTARDGIVEGGLIWSVGMLCQWLLLQIVAWAFRLRYGWRLSRIGQQLSAVTGEDLQFNIKTLLAWMLGIATLLGIGRWLLTNLIILCLAGYRIVRPELLRDRMDV